MAGSKRQKPPATVAPSLPPPSTTTQATAKYTNKDGSKFITVAKGLSQPVESPQPPPALAAPAPVNSKATTESKPADPTPAAPTVNRKKQKRREKAKLKAEGVQSQPRNALAGSFSPTVSASPSLDRLSLDVNFDDSEDEGDDYEAGTEANHAQGNSSTPSKSKKAQKKKKKATQPPQDHDLDEDDDYDQEDGHDDYDYGHDVHHHRSHVSHDHGHHESHRMPTHQRVANLPKRKIWDTSTSEERERIKDFWLGLGEDERKSLVKVEKNAVLKKMKEQQRQTCSCSVCGRKRTAIEEELEQLYDAYYKELEQFANRPPGHPRNSPPPMLSSQAHYGPGTGVHPSQGQPSNYTHQPSHGRIVEHVGDDDDEDDEDYEDEDDLEDEEEPEEYSDGQLEDDDGSEEDDEYSGDEQVHSSHHRPDYTREFFSFGNSLTVQGGILTVADDLLKNDGKKFIEMMEQLAEKRMQREEDAFRLRGTYGHANGNSNYSNHSNHNINSNVPLEEDEEEYEDDDEEYEGDDGDEEYDTDEENRMTEAQRMEEGRRMFQIFAARMFEQRVLQAYRKKLSDDRQLALIKELDQEQKEEAERKERKRLKEKLKKDQAKQKKQEAAEAKERKRAEKKAQEEAEAAEAKRKQDEQRQLAEKKRKEKEEQKKAEEEEKARKAQEARDRRAEKDRKAREAKQLKEQERERKEKQERERKEQERERKEQQERDRREQQEREQKERDAVIQAEREAKEKKLKAQRQQQQQQAIAPQKPQPPTAPSITLARRPAQTASGSPAPPPALPHQPSSISTTTVASPQVPVATPVIPFAPTSMRVRHESQQEGSVGSSDPHSVSSTSQVPSPHPMTPEQHTSPGPFGPHIKAGSIAGQGGYQPSQHASPMNMSMSMPLNSSFNHTPGQFAGFGGPPVSGGGFSSGPPGLQQPQGFGVHPGHGFAPQPFGSGFPSAVGPLQGMNSRPAHSRGFPPGFGQPAVDTHFSGIGGQGFPINQTAMHQRQSSIGGGFDAAPGTPLISSSQPRPTPIGRPGSVAQGQRLPPGLATGADGRGMNDSKQHQFGSSALLGDSEEVGRPFPTPTARRNTSVPGPTANPFNKGFYGDSVFSSGATMFPGTQFLHSPPPAAPPGLSSPWQTGTSLPNSSVFSSQPVHSRPQESHVRIRTRVIDAWRGLKTIPDLPEGTRLDGDWISLENIKAYTAQEGMVPSDRLLNEIFETLGDHSNGGGTFQTTMKNGRTYVRWNEDDKMSDNQRLVNRAVGHDAIGSPVVTNSAVAIGRRSS